MVDFGEAADAVRLVPCAPAPSWAQRIIRHLAFDPARDDAAPVSGHDFRAQLDENLVAGVAMPRLVLRGEWPSRGTACGA